MVSPSHGAIPCITFVGPLGTDCRMLFHTGVVMTMDDFKSALRELANGRNIIAAEVGDDGQTFRVVDVKADGENVIIMVDSDPGQSPLA